MPAKTMISKFAKVRQCSYRVAKQLLTGLPLELIHTLSPQAFVQSHPWWVRLYAVIAEPRPRSNPWRARSEQRRRTASTHRARDQSKCAGEPSARTRRLLHDRHGGGATKSSVELAAWLHAFTGPVTGDKRPRASDAPVTDGQGPARRVRHAALHAAPAPPNQ